MGQRNMLWTGQMIDLSMYDQAQGCLYREPSFSFGGRANFHQPSMHTISRGSTSFDVHNIQEHHQSALPYGMQYNGFPEPHPAVNLDLGVGTTSNLHNSYLIPASGAGLFQVPSNHVTPNQLPSSSNYGVIGISDGNGLNSHFFGSIRGSCKTKNNEGSPGNFPYHNVSPGSSSSAVPFNTRLAGGVAQVDVAPVEAHQYIGNGSLPIVDSGSQRRMRNISSAMVLDPVQGHTHNPLIQGSYMCRPFQPAGSDGGQVPVIAYTDGCMDIGNMNALRYHETASNRHFTSFMNPPTINHQHYIHHPQQHRRGARGLNVNFYPQVAVASSHVPTNDTLRSIETTSQDGLERERRHLRPLPPTRFRIYRPHLRMLHADEVAVLEATNFYEEENFFDRYVDMRLDIEGMSYEELLALGERIGNASTGLTEEIITSKLKTRNYVSSTTSINLEDEANNEQEAGACIICQADYVIQETIGTLDCGHEYHADCLKKWLLVKSICPICKSEALTTCSKDVEGRY